MSQGLATPQRGREREEFHLRRFASLYGFPSASLRLGDKPDLIVRTDTGNIGVELTKLVRVEGSSGTITPQGQEDLQDRVARLVRAIFEARGGGMVWTYLHFSQHQENALTRRDVDKVAQKLAIVMLHASQVHAQDLMIEGWQSLEGWEYSTRFPEIPFPNQIDRIDFKVVDRPGFVLWGVPRSCSVPGITAQYLQEKIDGKAKKLSGYDNDCSKMWLLLACENWLPSSYFHITSEVMNFTFKSNFNRVFYFELFDDRLVELKIANIEEGSWAGGVGG